MDGVQEKKERLIQNKTTTTTTAITVQSSVPLQTFYSGKRSKPPAAVHNVFFISDYCIGSESFVPAVGVLTVTVRAPHSYVIIGFAHFPAFDPLDHCLLQVQVGNFPPSLSQHETDSLPNACIVKSETRRTALVFPRLNTCRLRDHKS